MTRLVVGLLTLGLGACAVDEPPDELADETAADGEAGKDDSVAAFTYFIVNKHGTYYTAERYNRQTTDCRTGEIASRCIIETLDWSRSPYTDARIRGFDDAMKIETGGSFLVRADIATGGLSLLVTEAWIPGSLQGVIDGPALLVEDNGRRCVTTPCASITETRMNANGRTAEIDAIDLRPSRADAKTIEAAMQRLYEDRSLIVVGDRYYPDGGKGRRATFFWTRALAEP